MGLAKGKDDDDDKVYEKYGIRKDKWLLFLKLTFISYLSIFFFYILSNSQRMLEIRCNPSKN